MTKFAIYQIQLTDAEIDMINDGVQVRKHVLKTNMFGDKVVRNAVTALEQGFYNHVLTIDAENLNDVFYKGNFAHDHLADIQVHGTWSSLSVGDIIFDEQGLAFVIDTFGFHLLTEKIEIAA